jgi:DNA-binding Lrp family transcriptional regulator
LKIADYQEEFLKNYQGTKLMNTLDRIDEIDEKIISYLQANGFQTGLIIAKELGIPISTVHRRLQQMKNKKIFIVIVRTNALVLGFKYWVRVGINTTPGCAQDVIHHLVEHPSVYTVSGVASNYSLLLGARFRTENQLIHFIASELPSLPGIRNMETFLLIKPRKYLQFHWQYDESSDNNPDSLDAAVGKTTFELDKIDRGILDIITIDSQTTNQQLSKKLGVSVSTIQRHLKIMAENQVYVLDVLINPDLVDYEFVVNLGIVVIGRSAQSVLDEIMTDDQYVVNASMCIGRFNVWISCVFHRYEILNEYINVKLNNIPGIQLIEPFVHTKRYKSYVSQY